MCTGMGKSNMELLKVLFMENQKLRNIFNLNFYKKKEDWKCGNDIHNATCSKMPADENIQIDSEDTKLICDQQSSSLIEHDEEEISVVKPLFDTALIEVNLSDLSPEVLLTTAEMWLYDITCQQQDPILEPMQRKELSTKELTREEWECEDENPVGTLEEFMRGAHLRPHSSEVDLQLSQSMDEFKSTPSLALAADPMQMSSEELCASVYWHIISLRTLLNECHERKKVLSLLRAN